MRSSLYLTRCLPLVLTTFLFCYFALQCSSNLLQLHPILSRLSERADALHEALISPLASDRHPPLRPLVGESNASDELAVKTIKHLSHLPPGLANTINSYENYHHLALDVIFKKESRYLRQSPTKIALSQKLGYDKHFDAARKGIAVNAKFATEVARHARDVYKVGESEIGEEEDADYHLVDLSFGHLSRDWSAQGKPERDAVFPPVLEALSHFFGPQANGLSSGGKRVLVPGSGMGRLARFDVTANELDYGSIVTYRLLVNSSLTPSLHTHSLHPFSTKWTHQALPNARFSRITFPDHRPNVDVKLVEGDFLDVFEHETGVFDAVVTLFFIDMSQSVIDFLANIHRLLKPRGLWVNLGPLKWGTHADLQLSVLEVLELAELLGFHVDHTSRKSIDSVYAAQPDTLLKFTYVTQFWTATKRM
ncbi:N2227-domain-containing protein [Dacryopinax primogenitus]|uniref:N2227-domain-containing protein n=1 Tax=Dacryopinax primogenitus (strain DJM 731) TaxID=1858805 RepID=M5FSJ5_DACPD|nr:N2227-domain-containing protein [Dacryopinax primogenitus]EJU00426.1 N2227-domain-containing protein [Dacryopinax primogenitus]